MVQAFGALNEPAKAAAAQEVITDARPTASTFTQLAIFAYQAGQTRKGDLAKDKALELTDPDMREALKGQLESGEAVRGGRRGAAQRHSVASFYTSASALVAQLAEQRTLNPKVPGSIPGGGIEKKARGRGPFSMSGELQDYSSCADSPLSPPSFGKPPSVSVSDSPGF